MADGELPEWGRLEVGVYTMLSDFGDAVLQLQGLQFNPEFMSLSVWSSACSLHIHVGFLPLSKNIPVGGLAAETHF